MPSHLTFENPFCFDMALLDPVFTIMQRGLRVDTEKKDQLTEEHHDRWAALQAQLNLVAGRELNVNSNKQMVDFFYGELGLPKRYKDKKLTVDEDAIRALFAISEDNRSKKPDDYRWQRASVALLICLKIRTVRKALSSYLEVLCDKDGRMRSTYSVGKTETARWAASKTLWGTGLNLQTVPHSLRGIYQADDGMYLAEFDLNRGESWIYCHLANDPEMMRIHATNGDFHSETAVAVAAAFGGRDWTVDSIKAALKQKADPALYQEAYRIRYLGKKVNHASAYRMGPFRMVEVVNEESDDTGITIVVSQAKKAQELWKAKYFNMPRWWDGIERQLGERRFLSTPYGRERIFFGQWGDSLFKQATAYVPQSTSADYLNIGLLRVFHELDRREAFSSKIGGKVRHLELLHNNHDSILVQFPQEHLEEAMAAVNELLQSRLVVNGHDISIPTEGKFGLTWADEDLEEWKGG